jgi:hypothetical protein
LACENLIIGKNSTLTIELRQGKTGIRTIGLSKSIRNNVTKWTTTRIPKIIFPDEVYNFVKALDKIIIACDCKEFEDNSGIFNYFIKLFNF